nr:3'-5' exoribonuclease [uncultured Sphingomonas sp.]
MRYFLDTEYDGFGGPLLSLALVPEDGGEEFYIVIDHAETKDAWVERNVIPFLNMVPEALKGPKLSRSAAAEALSHWLSMDSAPDIIADWPEDLAQLSMLLVTGPGQMVHVPSLTMRFVPLHGFSTAANSKVPHNALHDARALREHILTHLE